MAFNPNKWGPTLTQKDFELFMAGETPADPQISLLEHALTSPSQELSDPVTAPVQKKVRGRIVTVNKTVRPAEQTALTYTLLFPSSFWTPALQKARQGGLCYTDFFAKYLCPESPEYEIAYYWPDSLLDPPSEVTDFTTNTTDTEQINEQTTLHTVQRETLWALRMDRQADQTNPLQTIAFNQEDCVGCTADIWTSLIAAGTPTAEDDAEAQLTDDRFATVTAVAMGIPADSIATKVFSKGAVRLVSFSDAAVASGTIGGVAASFDEGLTWVLDSNITAPMYGVAKFNDVYIAVGGTGTGAALVYQSSNGIDWTAVVSSALPASNAAYRLAVDEDGAAFYVGCEGGKLLKGTLSGGSILLADISTNLPTISGLLSAVAVLEKDHVVVGSTTGYIAESFDGGATFNKLAFASSSAVTGLAGDRFRLLVGAGTKVYERSILTNMELKPFVPQLSVSITGDITDLAMAPGDNNYFAAVTDDGEIIFFKPFFPNA